MSTLVQDLTIPQGVRFQYVFQLTGTQMPADISGFTAAMQVRPYPTSDEVYASFSSPADITVNNSTKQIVIDVDDSVTAVLDFVYGEYDLELTNPAGTTGPWRIAQGIATLSHEVTRA